MKTQQTLSPTDTLEELIQWLLPEQTNVRVDQLVFTPGELTLLVTSTQSEGRCPVCEKATRRIHSRYWRTLEDLPWGDSRLHLRVHVLRFFCPTPSCPLKIFTERLGPLAEASARRTSRLREALLALGWAVGGEEGARQGMVHHMPIGASTLLSLMRRHGESASPTPRVLGVDDWSFQRDHPTGTILVDLERHRPVDLLLGSDEQVLADWLHSHRGVQIISRDRGAGYRKAIQRAAPQVKQVLDRWHVLKNLGEVIQKTLAQQIDVLRQAGERVKQNTQQTCLAPTGSAQVDGRRRKPPRRKPPAPSPRRAWQMAMHQQVHELAARCENASRDHQPSASASQYGAQVSAHANICGPLLPSVSFSCRALSDLSRRARASRRGHDHHPVARVTRARLHRELQKCVGLRAPLAPSSRDDPRIIFILCGSRDSSECPCHPNAVAGQMAVVASARGSECSGCGLSAGIV